MLLYVLDLIGVAVFAISGALAAGRRGLDLLGVIALGAATAIGGGTTRDVGSAEVPLVLRRGNLYASAAIVGTTIYFVLEAAGVPRSPAALTGMAVCTALRFAAIWWGLQLPTLRLHGDDSPEGPTR